MQSVKGIRYLLLVFTQSRANSVEGCWSCHVYEGDPGGQSQRLGWGQWVSANFVRNSKVWAFHTFFRLCSQVCRKIGKQRP